MPKARSDEVDKATSLEMLELRLLLEAVLGAHGYDFRSYAPSSLLRRARKRMAEEGLKTLSGLQERVLHDPECMQRMLRDLSINVTAMFRDPAFHLAMRRQVVPIMRTYPFIRIWHAGCSTGEEVYSMAILLAEEGLLSRSRLYATDISEDVLRTAREGIFPLRVMRDYTANYQTSGGKRAFSDYYSAKYDSAIFSESLRENMVFSQHNLAMDGPFNEFNLIVCRNVMIYFNRDLQDRVHELLHGSLVRFGILALGSKESLRYSPHEASYRELDQAARLYQRVR